MMEETNKFEAADTVPESIKLMKMTKCYNWEIRVNSLDVKKLTEINNEMIDKFGTLLQE
jgi:hypothetical protein